MAAVSLHKRYNMSYVQTAALLLGEIERAKNYSALPAPHELFISAETIISGLATLIDPVLTLESEYRKELVAYMENGDSAAKAEAKAKAGENYRKWKKLQAIMELGEHQINLIKKFKEDIALERNRS